LHWMGPALRIHSLFVIDATYTLVELGIGATSQFLHSSAGGDPTGKRTTVES